MNIAIEIKLWGHQMGLDELRIQELTKNFTEVIEIFEEQGHSGHSASYINHMFNKAFVKQEGTEFVDRLLKDSTDILQSMITKQFYEIQDAMKVRDLDNPILWGILIKLIAAEPLTPLLGGEDEWSDITEMVSHKEGKCKSFPNKRCTSVFKDVFDNGIEIAYYINGQSYSDNGGTYWYGRGGLPRTQITFPFEIPAQEYIYTYEPFEDNDKMYYILTDEDTIKKVKELYDKAEESEHEIFRTNDILHNNYCGVTFIPENPSDGNMKIVCSSSGCKEFVTKTTRFILSPGLDNILKDIVWRLEDRKYYY